MYFQKLGMGAVFTDFSDENLGKDFLNRGGREGDCSSVPLFQLAPPQLTVQYNIQKDTYSALSVM